MASLGAFVQDRKGDMRSFRLLSQAFILGIAFAALAVGVRALFGDGDLLLVAWWMTLAFAFGFWTAKT